MLAALLLLAFAPIAIFAETGAEGWLRYAPVSATAAVSYQALPETVTQLGHSQAALRAKEELERGITSMLGRKMTDAEIPSSQASWLIGTKEEIQARMPGWRSSAQAGDECFEVARDGAKGWIIAGGSDHAELYGVFYVLGQVAQERALEPSAQCPSAPIRWVNEWDNFDGSIERGYGGRSIFFDQGHVRADLSRVDRYGRLLASVGINGAAVNNVNSDLRTLEPEMIHELARIADALRPWGVRMALSIDLSSPQIVGHLSTFDPVDPTVEDWWHSKVDEIYKAIPDFAGFVVKADSEGRLGPSKYGRTPAQAANCVVRALKPHGGVVLYRGFVYNNHLDWTDRKADRARAGYDNFHALDGTFEPNVVIQIKHGPIDFQVREPVSPLFAALQRSNQAIELQVTQEYTGQQRHMVFLVPMWKTALDTDMRVENRATPVKEIVEGKSFHQPLGGFVGVANVGLEPNWMHHPMALANLYGFGKLAWNPNLTTAEIIDSWTRLTFGNNPQVVRTIDDLQRNSWHVYEQYTGNLGIGTLTDIVGPHYGPRIESAERNGWGQWFRGERDGIGMDRTVATGTGYIGQYPPEFAKMYESLANCPDDLLLFMHHVPYNYKLHDGKTVVQHVYDEHYAGAATAATYVARWRELHGLIDEERYNQVLALFTYQAGHAFVWRDAVTRWFQRISGIEDREHRVGIYADRIEAESMQADGYEPVDVTPWENASNGKAVVCKHSNGCTLTTDIARPAGSYSVSVRYFDYWRGVSRFTLLVNDKIVGEWRAGDTLPPVRMVPQPNGDTSTRITFPSIKLKRGDRLTLRGIPDDQEPAPLDYIEIFKD